MTDPHLIEGPAVVSFSGGRTSAHMLWRIIQAHGGTLPDNIVVVFANTGKEREATLRFVYECGSRWGVPIHWVEWRKEQGFEEVGFNSASRKGEPFAALIASKQRVPNWQERWCTGYLKVLTIKAFLQSIGWTAWTNVVGLRYDEKGRVSKQWEKNAAGKEPWQSIMPLYRAGVTKRDVMAFWAEQPFDLQLKPHEGNCDDCYLKGKRNLKALIAQDPASVAWWIEQERIGNGTFSSRYSYADLLAQVQDEPDLFYAPDEEYDVECGDSCETDFEAAA